MNLFEAIALLTISLNLILSKSCPIITMSMAENLHYWRSLFVRMNRRSLVGDLNDEEIALFFFFGIGDRV